MSLADQVDRHGRAIILSVTLLAAAGLIAGAGLPSSIYPRLEFPRVVIIGHSGTLPARTMMLSVTRPLEQAVMEVPGIRRVRSTTFRGATEISAQFEPSSDMVENYLIGPKVYGGQLRLSNLAVLLAFAVGAELFGILGALLALPVAAMYPCVEDVWLRDYLGRDAVETHRRIEKS